MYRTLISCLDYGCLPMRGSGEYTPLLAQVEASITKVLGECTQQEEAYGASPSISRADGL